jgi:putative endonuclease
MSKEHNYFVYILASRRNGTLYIGVTNSLLKRTLEHKEREHKNSFTDIYEVIKLVYYEHYQNISDAIVREKQLKKWNRAWKIRLIEEFNPNWRDLFNDMM